jgi:hypothetical protein
MAVGIALHTLTAELGMARVLPRTVVNAERWPGHAASILAGQKDCIVLKPQAYRVQREIRTLDSHLCMFSEPVN